MSEHDLIETLGRPHIQITKDDSCVLHLYSLGHFRSAFSAEMTGGESAEEVPTCQ